MSVEDGELELGTCPWCGREMNGEGAECGTCGYQICVACRDDYGPRLLCDECRNGHYQQPE
ncbi:MAG TPA: hypothetical protein VF316_25275 [Polyangiaceae bacterium]